MSTNPQPELHLLGYSFSSRFDLVPDLGVAIDHAGGWVLERRTLSASALQFVLEASGTCLPEIYAAFLQHGIELTRDSHRAITQRVICNLNLPPRRGISSIVLLLLEIRFLDEPWHPLENLHIPRQACAAA